MPTNLPMGRRRRLVGLRIGGDSMKQRPPPREF